VDDPLRKHVDFMLEKVIFLHIFLTLDLKKCFRIKCPLALDERPYHDDEGLPDEYTLNKLRDLNAKIIYASRVNDRHQAYVLQMYLNYKKCSNSFFY
jgi:hypothetical protein